MGSEPRVWSFEEALSSLNGKTEPKEDEARQISYLFAAFGQVLPPDDRRYRPALEKLAANPRAAVPTPER